jgi:hypothetical protein
MKLFKDSGGHWRFRFRVRRWEYLSIKLFSGAQALFNFFLTFFHALHRRNIILVLAPFQTLYTASRLSLPAFTGHTVLRMVPSFSNHR